MSYHFPSPCLATYKAIMIAFGIIGAVMMGLLARRLIVLVNNSFLSPPSKDTDAYLNQVIADAAGSTQIQEQVSGNPDQIQVLINAMLGNVTQVLKSQIQLNIESQNMQALTYLIALASTFGVYFVASFIQMDFAHMFTVS